MPIWLRSSRRNRATSRKPKSRWWRKAQKLVATVTAVVLAVAALLKALHLALTEALTLLSAWGLM